MGLVRIEFLIEVQPASPCNRRGLAALGLVATVCLSACSGAELEDCNQAAAQELVYGRNGTVATKGQALAHDSCGSAAFCHSANATADLRHGAPRGMNFDMLPLPSGLEAMLEQREKSWELVASEAMPPSDAREVLSDGDWSFDPHRRPDAPRLPPLSSEEGKAAFRNWLACGAPTVSETTAPAWARSFDFVEGQEVVWEDLYAAVLGAGCVGSGCHNAATSAGGLALEDACQAREALLGSGICQRVWVVPGKPEESFLVTKLEPGDPGCNGPMPPSGTLPEPVRKAISAWIAAGAKADCP